MRFADPRGEIIDLQIVKIEQDYDIADRLLRREQTLAVEPGALTGEEDAQVAQWR